MNVIKNYFFVIGLLFCKMTVIGQTVTFLTENGNTAETICDGQEVQLNLEVTDIPGTDSYTVNWTQSVPMNFIRGCTVPDASGVCNFLRVRPDQTTTYTIEVFGTPMGNIQRQITITVEQVPNPGLDTNIFLCGKTGIINLFDELDGGPDPGGTWSNGTGTYDTADPNGGSFTYTIAGGGVCPDQSATITLRPCGVNDSDGDGVPNDMDLDIDNDGIPNTQEDNLCTASSTTTPIFVLEEDFGFGGPTRSRYAEGLGLTYNPTLPQDTSNDGEYNVATSTYFRTAAGFDATFLSTDLIGEVDANGDVDGRYLAINMNSPVFADDPVFVVEDLPVTPGLSYDFSMSIASLNNNTGELPANLTIQVVDQVTDMVLFQEDSGDIANGTDIWNDVTNTFVAPAGVFIVSIRVINRQGTAGNGNDIGIDNIFLSTNACDFDRDGIPNSEDLDSDNDGIYDVVENGNATLDTDGDGRVDGGVNGTGNPVGGRINMIDTDADGNENFLDIDSDGDGIIDHIEGQSTAGYRAPSGIDGDFNGVDDAFDTNGTVIVPVNSNTSAAEDYVDTNSDPDTGDCLEDTIEGYDIDQDGVADIVPSASDTDGDGLDDAFDTVVLGRLTGGTNANNGGTVPTDFPNNHNPGTPELDWREEFMEIDEAASVDGCSGSTAPFDLFDELTDAAIPGGTWTGPAGSPALTNGEQGTFTPGTNAIGDYVYTLPTFGTCPTRIGTVTVNLGTLPDPGTDGTLDVCTNDTNSYNLIQELGGTPDAGGSWTDPNGDPFGTDDRGVFDPTSDPEGTYTYTAGTTGCQDTADVVVTFITAPDPGEDGSLTVCSSAAAVNLFDSLMGTPDTGGSWTGPGPITGAQGTIDPATAVAGDYTYTIFTQQCPNPETAIVTVTIETLPNAGMDGSLPVCLNDTMTNNLFDSLQGTPDTGGSWTDPNGDPFGADDQGVFDPSMNAAGTYTYTVGTTGCQDTAEVAVTINTGADPGADGSIALCSEDTAVNLFDSLTGTPDMGGTWTGPGPTTNGDQGTIDPATAISGDYIYTVTTAQCPNPATATVSLSIETTPTLTLDATNCAMDRMSFDIIYTTNGNWDISIVPNIGTIDVATSTIIGIPANTDVTITAVNPANTNCQAVLPITAPNCDCPTDIPIPVNSTVSNNDTVCFGEANQELMVTVGMGLTANWYDENGDLVAGSTLVYTPVVTEIGTYSFFVEAFDTTENCPSDQIEIIYSINGRPEIDLFVEGAICVDAQGVPVPGTALPFIDTGLSTANYTFQWEFEGTVLPDTGANITATQAGSYSVTVTEISSGCFDTATTTIESVISIAPGDLSLSLSNGQFSSTNNIIATVGDGNQGGAYEYSLDGGPFQSDNVFRNVSFGEHVVTVVDINGCGEDTATIKIFGFPPFFTPNGDDRNDTWNVKIMGDEELPPMDINIFDRYGKLMKKQRETDIGWDGTFNGEPMPSTDYWFSVQFMDGTGQEFRGHFNLRR